MSNTFETDVGETVEEMEDFDELMMNEGLKNKYYIFKKTDNLNDAMEHFYSGYTDWPVAIIAMEDKQMLIQPINARFRSTQMTMDMQRKDMINEDTGEVKVMILQLGRPYGGDSDTGRVLPIQKTE